MPITFSPFQDHYHNTAMPVMGPRSALALPDSAVSHVEIKDSDPKRRGFLCFLENAL